MDHETQTESAPASDPAVGCSAWLGITDQRELAIVLCAQTKTHDAWLSVVRFGLHTLLDDQLTLIECVLLEAERERERKKNQEPMSVHAWEILEELELELTTRD